MMDLSNKLVLLNGKPKTLQIKSIDWYIRGRYYYVRFKNRPQTFKYSPYKVTILTDPEWLPPETSKVYVGGKIRRGVLEIWRFKDWGGTYWRIKYDSGREMEYSSDKVDVRTSCLSEKRAKNTFSYLTDVAYQNPLGKEENETGILGQIYQDVRFIDDCTAAAPYLNPNKKECPRRPPLNIIYPFGCNLSQKKAVETAFAHQISVIQGPPGTGKTQTILNLIANIVAHKGTVLVVSNNNSAIINVREKLEKYGLGFIVATLGKKDNKEDFIENQPYLPEVLSSWKQPSATFEKLKKTVEGTQRKLEKVYALQNTLAQLRQERETIELEWEHFRKDNNISMVAAHKKSCASEKIMTLWLRFQQAACRYETPNRGLFNQLGYALERLRLRIAINSLNTENKYDIKNPSPLILELQALYYLNRRQELDTRTERVTAELSPYNADRLLSELTESSMSLLKSILASRYSEEREPLSSTKDFKRRGEEFLKDYPVVLSTTYSARKCLFKDDMLYDYLIMDEASQVSIETGALALTCAKNAVIVGDSLQLPNVVTDEERSKLTAIMRLYKIPEGYDCAKNSFLQSICEILKDVPQTLLREHYRCHPRIINFCNQKFYGGKLLIMTEDKGERDVMCAFRTVRGNHAIGNYNQREIDVVKAEVLPQLTEYKDVGIVTPYNNQVCHFNRELPELETATIHKFQGREKDAIIMSVVDNHISPFADNANILNVAVSRAKKKFCLVVTGNEQEKRGNITDLLDYIEYNNCTVTESKVSSIFDNLYEQYTNAYLALSKGQKKISGYDSENMTYALIRKVLGSDSLFSNTRVYCHLPLRQIIKDNSLMNDDERKYAGNFWTHVDFLITNAVTKKPLLGIETDGYSYHNDQTEQHRRDLLKDHIFQLYNIPLLRLSTKGSNEEGRLTEALHKLIQ